MLSSLPIIVFAHTMDSPTLDPQISNGTCYYAADLEDDPRFIPCGNSAFGNVPCCESADVCLSSLACYNAEHGVTYLAGCMDPAYEDDNCPDKDPYTNQSWVGLSYCGNREWVGCANPPASQQDDLATVVLVPTADCSCSDTAMEPQFTDANPLANYLSLPTALGLTYAWGGGLTTNAYQSVTTPTASPSTTGSATTVSTSTTAPLSTGSTMVASVLTITSTLPGQSSPGTALAPASTSAAASTVSTSSSPSFTPISKQVSVSTVAGVATGSAVGFVILVAAIAALLLYRHRNKSRGTTADDSAREKSTRADSKVYTDDIVGSAGYGGPVSPSYKSELPADSITSPSVMGSSTLAGSVATPSVGMRSPNARVGVEDSPVPGPWKRTELPSEDLEAADRRDTYYELSA